MGHYDDCYEAERRVQEATRREDLLRWISDETMNMSNYDLELVWDVVENVEDFRGFINVVERISKNGRAV